MSGKDQHQQQPSFAPLLGLAAPVEEAQPAAVAAAAVAHPAAVAVTMTVAALAAADLEKANADAALAAVAAAAAVVASALSCLLTHARQHQELNCSAAVSCQPAHCFSGAGPLREGQASVACPCEQYHLHHHVIEACPCLCQD